jgi:hypothetical protein
VQGGAERRSVEATADLEGLLDCEHERSAMARDRPRGSLAGGEEVDGVAEAADLVGVEAIGGSQERRRACAEDRTKNGRPRNPGGRPRSMEAVYSGAQATLGLGDVEGLARVRSAVVS